MSADPVRYLACWTLYLSVATSPLDTPLQEWTGAVRVVLLNLVPGEGPAAEELLTISLPEGGGAQSGSGNRAQEVDTGRVELQQGAIREQDVRHPGPAGIIAHPCRHHAVALPMARRWLWPCMTCG